MIGFFGGGIGLAGALLSTDGGGGHRPCTLVGLGVTALTERRERKCSTICPKVDKVLCRMVC